MKDGPVFSQLDRLSRYHDEEHWLQTGEKRVRKDRWSRTRQGKEKRTLPVDEYMRDDADTV